MIYDISPLISKDLAVFPGDRAFQRDVSLDFAKGDHLTLSAMASTLHLGAHADAPSHYHPKGQSIDQCPLETYLGLCQVIDVVGQSGEIRSDHLRGIEVLAPRILFKTNSIVDSNHWQAEFCYLSTELVRGLAQKGVCLIGIDTPSMDHSNSKSLNVHRAFFEYGIAILEGLALKEVAAGLYTLIALPLKLQGAEASPVRAVLVDQLTLKK